MVQTIYSHFASQTRAPVYLKDVKQFILNTGEATIIRRFPVEMDELVLRGMLRVFRDRPPYAIEDRIIADIAYYKNLHPYDVRLVCCKEMMHLLDNHHATAGTREQVSLLVEEITLPIEAVTSLPTLTDQAKLLHALCILMPKASIDLMKPDYDNKKLSVEDIAKIVQIPPQWVRVAMSDRWGEIQGKIHNSA
jgi:Zn-dependent peptidase ImmA (M78 family)